MTIPAATEAVKPSKSKTSVIFSNLIFAVSTLSAVCVLLAAYYAVTAFQYYRQHQTHYSGDSFIQEDPLIGYAQRPNITMKHSAPPVYTVYTDSMGARASGPGMIAPDKIDVMAIGCSFTWGHGVEDPDTYIKVIGRKTGLSASNVALASYGTTSSLLSLEKFAHLNPKIVIYGFIDNHIARSLQPCAPSLSPYCRSVAFVDFDSAGKPFIRKPEFISPLYYQYTQEVVLDHSFGVRDIYWAVQRDWLRLSKKDKQGINAPYVQRTPEEKQKALDFLIQQLVNETEQINARLVIAYLPVVTGIKPASPELMHAIEPYLKSKSIFFADLSKPLQDYADAHGVESLKAGGGVDGHPSEAAHRVIAENLIPIVESVLRSGTRQHDHRF